MVELLLLIPSDSFSTDRNLIKDLIKVVKLSETKWIRESITKSIIHRSISLTYTLAINMDLCKIIKEVLDEDGMMKFFDELSVNSSDKHIRFTAALINWTMNREDMAIRQYSPEMIKTFVRYLNKCVGDPLQQCHGVPIDTMITTLTGMYTTEQVSSGSFSIIRRLGLIQNDQAQEELVRQDAVPAIVECATDANFDASTVQQPALECLWTMVFMPEVLLILSQSQEFITHLKSLLDTNRRTTDPRNK